MLYKIQISIGEYDLCDIMFDIFSLHFAIILRGISNNNVHQTRSEHCGNVTNVK